MKPSIHERTSPEEIAAGLHPVLEEKGVIRAVLFGSVARGDDTRKSDIDLMIIVESDRRFIDRYKDFTEIYTLFPFQDVDILIYTPEEFDAMCQRPFIQQILRDGIVVYERGKAAPNR